MEILGPTCRILLLVGLASSDPTLTTIAGTSIGNSDDTPGTDGSRSSARLAQLNGPTAIAFDRNNNGLLYVCDTDNNRVRIVEVTSDFIRPFAGSLAGDPGDDGDGLPAQQALLNKPMGVAIGPDGTV
eukprot:TRINITY_DN32531_c0_g1_i1.p1 TRINITY_DN32531_c0_g1~~TRINITY_DN32531_c0_g1_i1.p1  ORF type:complete len:128 (-),score=29.09 TRINITY_DN32531_c0_g1_i1:266-649(-)